MSDEPEPARPHDRRPHRRPRLRGLGRHRRRRAADRGPRPGAGGQGAQGRRRPGRPRPADGAVRRAPARRRGDVGGEQGQHRRPGPADRRPGLDHRPARRHPRVLRAAARRLGRARRAVAGTASWSPARSPSPGIGTTFDTGHPPLVPPRTAERPRIAVSRTRPPAFVRAPGRGDRRGPGPDGLGRRQGHLGGARRQRRLRARRRDVRVGLRRAGRRGPVRRPAHQPHRRVAAGLQPGRGVAARPGGLPARAGRLDPGLHRRHGVE